MRNIGGIGQGNGPFITYHDGFTKPRAVSIAQGGWNGFLPGADRVGIDTHPYLCFDTPNNDGLAYQAMKVRCRSLAPLLRALLTRWDSPVRTGPTTSTRLPARSVSRWEPSGVSPVRRPFASHFLELGLNRTQSTIAASGSTTLGTVNASTERTTFLASLRRLRSTRSEIAMSGTFVASRSRRETALLTRSVAQDWENYTAEMKAGLMLVASAHMDALRVR